MGFFVDQEQAFGLDISNRCLRLIQLKKGRKTSVKFYNQIKLPPDCIQQGEISQPKIFIDNLKKLLKTKQGRGQLAEEVVAVLPETKTFMKVLEIPKEKEKNIPEKIKKILPEQIPINPEEIYFDWQIISQKKSRQTVLVGVSPKKIVNSYLEILSQAGLTPIVLEIEPAAIARTLFGSEPQSEASIIIDIGASRTGLFLYDRQTVKFTISLPISGNKITEIISETLDLEKPKAEQAKIVCGLDRQKCQGALLEIFQETINQLTREITKAINFYQTNFSETQKVTKIILTGGGANFINISEVLQEKLGIPITLSQPWKKIENPAPDYFTPERSQSFIPALGLALRGLDPKTFYNYSL